jgi:predicted membrane protein
MLVDQSQTVIFFWSYVAIIYFVVFNIALAVILEVYSDIRRQNQDYFRAKKASQLTSEQEGEEERQEDWSDQDGNWNSKVKTN